ncbi:MAG: fibronectin type III domain-containing protein [Ruminiclostridium sp.]|nr:fibronectin type III domain-containing protein [Ruminiclostridium sp.]
MKIKALSLFAISLSATAVFAVANVAFAEDYENADNIGGISVSVADSILDSSDIRTGYTVDSEGKLVTKSYYDIYSLDNLTLNVSYISGEEASYTGTEITALTAQTGYPFVISDNQDEAAWSVGTYTVTCSFAGKTADISFSVKESDIASVTITPQYDISFIQGLDETEKTVILAEGGTGTVTELPFDKQHYAVNITYRDGSTARYTVSELLQNKKHSVKFSAFSGELSTGTHTASCYIDGVKADFNFTVIENPVSKLELYIPEENDTLSFSEDGLTDYDKEGKPYPRFLIDKSLIKVKVTSPDGTVKNMSLSQLCELLNDRLTATDNQALSPWNSNIVTMNFSIRNIPCTLTFNIVTESVKKLSVSDISPFTAKLCWDRVYCAGYEVLVYQKDSWQVVSTLPFGKEEFTTENLTPSANFRYGVRSYVIGENGEKIYTDIVSADFTTPVWQVELSPEETDKTDSSISLCWKTTAFADGYIVYIKRNEEWTEVARAEGRSADRCTVTGLSPSTDYSFCIKAYKTAGNHTELSNDSVIDCFTAPSAVSGLRTASQTDSNITIVWRKNDSADGYIIKSFENGKWIVKSKLHRADMTKYTLSGFSPSSECKLSVTAYKMRGDDIIFGADTIITGFTLPSAVTGVKAVKSAEDAVMMYWDENTLADGYVISVYKNGECIKAIKLHGSDKTRYAIKDFSDSCEYMLYVKAYKMYGNLPAYGKNTGVSVNFEQ